MVSFPCVSILQGLCLFFITGRGKFLFPVLLPFRAVKEEMFSRLVVFSHLNSWVDIVSPIFEKATGVTFGGRGADGSGLDV